MNDKYKVTEALLKENGERHLRNFSRARISLSEARKVVNETYTMPDVTEATKVGLAQDLHRAALDAQSKGFVLPWVEDVGTLFMLTQEDGRAVYVPGMFYDEYVVNRLNKDDQDGYARVAKSAIDKANERARNEQK